MCASANKVITLHDDITYGRTAKCITTFPRRISFQVCAICGKESILDGLSLVLVDSTKANLHQNLTNMGWVSSILLYYKNFKASALWADAFYKLICPYVCVCVCVSVHF